MRLAAADGNSSAVLQLVEAGASISALGDDWCTDDCELNEAAHAALAPTVLATGAGIAAVASVGSAGGAADALADASADAPADASARAAVVSRCRPGLRPYRKPWRGERAIRDTT